MNKRFPPLHPFLFAVHPILFVWSSDLGDRGLSEIVWPVYVAAGTTIAMLWALNRFVAWDMRRAGIWVSYFMCMFFSYWVSCWIFGVANHFFVLIWSLAVILGTVGIARLSGPLEKLTNALNIMGCVLVLIPVLILTHIPTGAASTTLPNWEENSRDSDGNLGRASTTTLNHGGGVSDIYYIILDAYARSDVLKDTYQLDNGPFLDWLCQKGFYVAGKSTANYNQTALSLACSLNYSYLDSRLQGSEYETLAPKLLGKMIRTNRIMSALKAYGYKSVAFGSGYSPTDLTTADVYVAPFPQVSVLTYNLMAMTPLYPIHDLLFNRYGLGNDLHRRQISLTLENLAEVAKGRSFVFCHLLAPHPPFVFDENGQPVDPKRPFSLADGSDWHEMNASLQERYRLEYRKQIRFINNKIMLAIEKIIATSNDTAIIILQADHGPRSGTDWHDRHAEWSDVKEAMGILNAYHVPRRVRKFLYPEISPVNSFRLILKHCFGQPLELLPDKNYFSSRLHTFDWTNVTERLR